MANMTTLVVTCVPNPDEQESIAGEREVERGYASSYRRKAMNCHQFRILIAKEPREMTGVHGSARSPDEH